MVLIINGQIYAYLKHVLKRINKLVVVRQAITEATTK